MIETLGIVKRFGRVIAVDHVTFSVPAGAVCGFLGPNGAGKTTTIRMILDILKPDSGTISILGHNSALNVRQRIGYLPEEKGLYKKMKVWAIISYFATLKGMDKRIAKQRAFELLETYGLKDYAESKVESLSKGMGQKVQVLSAVAHRPELVILDEPFSALDFEMTLFIREKLQQVFMQTGTTMMLVSHDLEEAVYLADEVLLLTKRPTQVAEILRYEDARPRTLETLSMPSFIETKKRSLEIFQREVRR